MNFSSPLLMEKVFGIFANSST